MNDGYSVSPGGAAAKAGDCYEALWGILGFIEVLNRNAICMRVEIPGEDGAEFDLEIDGKHEYWQVKRQVLSQKTWTLAKLRDILVYFSEKNDEEGTCIFASTSVAPELRVLANNSRKPDALEGFKKHFLTEERLAQFREVGSIIGKDEHDTWTFLRSIQVRTGDEITLAKSIEAQLSGLLSGRGITAKSVLSETYMEGSHTSFDKANLLSILKEHKILERSGLSRDAETKIKSITDSYLAGQQAKLIGNTHISRKEASQLVKKLSESSESLDVMITSSAGGGKSACSAQVAEQLGDIGMPVLAFRLDLLEASVSTVELGKGLGLSESPALVMADTFPSAPITIIIDQLDCVSSISGRRSEFFDTVASLRREVHGLRSHQVIHLILICREFDLEHDYRLKAFCGDGVEHIKIKSLAIGDVKEVIVKEGGDCENLSSKQLQMLTHPQNLSLFVTSGLANSKTDFISEKDLLDAYWRVKKRIAEQFNDTPSLWTELIKHIVTVMSENQTLSISDKLLDRFPESYVGCLASEGVISIDNKRCSFGHETFFDYCFARTYEGGATGFTKFLKKDEQHLFRRGQLRQILVFTRDDDFEKYLELVRDLISNARIRAHLKLLIIDLIASQFEPTKEEFEILLPVIQKEVQRRSEKNKCVEILEARICDKFLNARNLFQLALEQGIIGNWVKKSADCEELVEILARYLVWQTYTHGDAVAEIIEPLYVKDRWKQVCWNIFSRSELERSRNLVDLLLKMIDNEKAMIGSRDLEKLLTLRGSSLYGLAREKPSWFTEVLGRNLEFEATKIARKSNSRVDNVNEFCGDIGDSEVISCAQNEPECFLRNVLPSMLKASEICLYKDEGKFGYDSIWTHRFLGEHIYGAEIYLMACEEAFDLIEDKKSSWFITLKTQMRNCETSLGNMMLIAFYLRCPDDFADEALKVLIKQPERIECGYSCSSFAFTKKLINRFSSHCSDEVFKELEFLIINYERPYERTKDGRSYRGYPSYTLAVDLDENRISRHTKRKIGEGFRKHGEVATPRGSRCYSVKSPISQEAIKWMSDKHWLKAISKYNHDYRIMDFGNPEKGGGRDLACALKDETSKDPERFFNLMLKLPEGTLPSYVWGILTGLIEAEVEMSLQVSAVEFAMKYGNKECYHTCLGVIGKLGALPLTQEMTEYVKKAGQHPDPEKDRLKQSSQNTFGHDLISTGINSVRGWVAECIRSLIFTDQCYVDVFQETISSFVSDENLAVRAVLASTLSAVASRDFARAYSWFTEMVSDHDELLSASYVQKFVRQGLSEYPEQMTAFVKKMLDSSDDDIVEQGGMLAALMTLHYPPLDEMSKRAAVGSEAARKGVCSVAARNILSSDCRQWCESNLIVFFNDEYESVRKYAADTFRTHRTTDGVRLVEYESLISKFTQSKAFEDEPTYLLYALESSEERIPDITLEVIEAFISRLGDEARDSFSGIAADELTVGKLLFKTYAQTRDEKLKSRALDLIDKMSLEGLYSVSREMVDFDR